MSESPIQIALTPEGRRVLRQLLANMNEGSIRETLRQVFARLASRCAGWIVKNYLSGQALKRRTGSLARSITGQGVVVNGAPGMRVGVFRGPAARYARIQELGGTIRPVNARALAFAPEGSPALTPAGVDRYGGPRSFPEELKAVYWRSSGSKVIGVLYRKSEYLAARAAHADIRTLTKVYILLRQADIPAKHYLLNGMRTFIPTVANELMTIFKSLLSSRQLKEKPGAAGQA